MAIPPNASTANSESLTELTALVAAANQKFIDQFVIAQAQAISLGKYQVYQTTFQHCNISTLMSYFVGLGYFVVFPEFAPLNGSQPGELFGPAWIAYWQNQLLPNNSQPHNPVRMGIAWQPPFVPPVEPV